LLFLLNAAVTTLKTTGDVFGSALWRRRCKQLNSCFLNPSPTLVVQIVTL